MDSEKQKSILLVDDEPDILELLEIIIESEIDINITKKTNVSDSITHLESHQPDLIISDYNMPGGNGLELYHQVKSLYNIPFIFLSAAESSTIEGIQEFFQDNPKNSFIEKPAEEAEILTTIKSVLEHQPIKSSIYKKVKIENLKKMLKSDCDLFIKMGEDKFVKIADRVNKDAQIVFAKYQSKVDYLYLDEVDYIKYIETLKESLASSRPSEVERIEILGLAFSLSKENLKTLGISKIHSDLVNKSMESIIGDIKSNPNIFQLLTSFLSRNDYLVDHSILNIYFSSYILSKLGWSNEQALKQIVYACFLHDISLDNPEEAMIENLESLHDEEIKLKVKNHGLEAAKILEQINGINHDAHKIIMDHHEKPDGSGFPQGLKANQIPPLSCVFLISHHIIDFLCREKFKTKNLATFLQEMEPIWGKGNFKRVYNCTRKILLD